MMKKFLSALCLILSLNLLSQQRVQGVIRDAQSSEILPFTNIAFVGKNGGTVANADGQFQLIVSDKDTLKFSHVGYQSLQIPSHFFSKTTEVLLKPSSLNLNAVEVLDRSLTAREVIKKVKEAYDSNHPEMNFTQELFYHRYEKVPFSKNNRITIKESDFAGLDKNTIEDLLTYIPDEFIEYQDGILQFHNYEDSHKLTPVMGISLQEQKIEDLEKMMEERLGVFFEDVKQTHRSEDSYYKFRTGILAFKAENPDDSVLQALERDSTHYPVSTSEIKYSVRMLLKHFTTMDGKNLEFLDNINHYRYQSPEVDVLNDELVYTIKFEPESKGLFQGVMHIARSDYAILQLEFEFADGKSSADFDLLGFGHSTYYKSGRIIYERTDQGCFPKYLKVNIKEKSKIDRSFSIMKKEKRWLWDKTVNEIKMSADMEFAMDGHWEILVQSRTPITEKQFQAIKEPTIIFFDKAISNDPQAWKERTVIAPTEELQNYIRSE